MFQQFYSNANPYKSNIIVQKQDTRYLIQNPPPMPLTTKELDKVFSFDYELDVHPFYKKLGTVKALQTIRFSITSHRGCFGECHFCAIAVHQGSTVTWRSKHSILSEAKKISQHPQFKGMIHDLGGPTANMYGMECNRKQKQGHCENRHCLFPRVCTNLNTDHAKQIDLLNSVRNLPNIKKVVIASGIRYDLILADKKNGINYLEKIIQHHISGQIKIAPEHTVKKVLDLMNKPGIDCLLKFNNLFYRIVKKKHLKLFLTYYLIAAHPGCTKDDMQKLKQFFLDKIGICPEQIQIFTPTPSTISSLMYWTEFDPIRKTPVFVEKTNSGREKQKSVLIKEKNNKNRNVKAC